MQETLKTANIK